MTTSVTYSFFKLLQWWSVLSSIRKIIPNPDSWSWFSRQPLKSFYTFTMSVSFMPNPTGSKLWPKPRTNIAIEHGHRNSWFTNETWWFSIVFSCMFTVYQRLPNHYNPSRFGTEATVPSRRRREDRHRASLAVQPPALRAPPELQILGFPWPWG